MYVIAMIPIKTAEPGQLYLGQFGIAIFITSTKPVKYAENLWCMLCLIDKTLTIR